MKNLEAKRAINILSKCVEQGFEIDENKMFEDLLAEAEEFVLDYDYLFNVIEEEFHINKNDLSNSFNSNKNSQNASFRDKKGVWYETDGDLVNDYRKRTVFHITIDSDCNIIKWVFVPEDDTEKSLMK